MEKMIETLELLPIYGVYLVMFFLAAKSKFASNGVPDWFLKQFSGTALNLFPGSLPFQFYLIAALEALVCVGLVWSLIWKEFLPGSRKTVLRGSLLFACFIFVILSVGLRLTQDFNTAYQVFVYLAVSWLLFKRLGKQDSKEVKS